MMGIKVRLAVAGLLAAMATSAVAPPLAHAGTTTCRVRNVTQGTHGDSFKAMVVAAVDGDRLTVGGTCEGGVVIWSDLIIKGIGDLRPVLTGRNRHRVLRVRFLATVTLRHLAMVGGTAAEHNGGGILNSGTLTLARSVVRGNSGGGINNQGVMTVADSLIRDNRGGGITNSAYDSYPTLTLTRSVVRGNTARYGGGINNWGHLTLTRSVVRGNTARYGGGISGVFDASLADSVVRGNTARRGGGVWNFDGTLKLVRSSVTGNTAGTGGGIWNSADPDHPGTVTLEEGSTVTGNTPDDCHGTTAC